jgi:transcription-repair coupling factor (superfamily II helicase)
LDLKTEIIDKFGKLPQEAESLFKMSCLRIYLSMLKIHKLKLKENNLKLFFKNENFSDVSSFEMFNRIIADLEKTPKVSFSVKEIKEEVCLNIFITLRADFLDWTIEKIKLIVENLKNKDTQKDESTEKHIN